MKKFVSIALVLCVLMSGIISVQAQTITREDYGIKFNVPEKWKYMTADGNYPVVYHTETETEFLIMGYYDDLAYDISFLDKEYLKSIAEDYFTKENLLKRYTKNDLYPDIVNEQSYDGYVKLGKETYYKYSKRFTVTAHYGAYAKNYLEELYFAAKNGILYIVAYTTVAEEEHPEDLKSILSSIDFSIGDIKILMNNERIYPDTSPILKNDRTMVPIRAIAEKMGYNVSWDEKTETVTITSADKGDTLQLVIGNDYIMKNNSEKISLDVPAFVLNDRTYIPLRAVTEAVGAKVDWDEETKSVIIMY